MLSNGQWQLEQVGYLVLGQGSMNSSFSGDGTSSRTDNSTYAISGEVSESGNESYTYLYSVSGTNTGSGWLVGGMITVNGSGTASRDYSGSGSFSSGGSTSNGHSVYGSQASESGSNETSFTLGAIATLVGGTWVWDGTASRQTGSTPDWPKAINTVAWGIAPGRLSQNQSHT